MPEILIFHADLEASRDIGAMLEKENFTASLADDVQTGLRHAHALNSQLILADLPFPGISGIDLCMQLRSSQMQRPIIVLTEGDEIDRILLLEAGADDCMIKPFSMRELLARIRALMRRVASMPGRAIHFGDVEIDPVRRIITRRGKQVAVSPCEYKLLLFFLQNVERPLTREALLNFVWGYDQYPNTRTVDTHVMKLRSKFEPEPSVPRHFVTIHGIGYRFLM